MCACSYAPVLQLKGSLFRCSHAHACLMFMYGDKFVSLAPSGLCPFVTVRRFFVCVWVTYDALGSAACVIYYLRRNAQTHCSKVAHAEQGYIFLNYKTSTHDNARRGVHNNNATNLAARRKKSEENKLHQQIDTNPQWQEEKERKRKSVFAPKRNRTLIIKTRIK